MSCACHVLQYVALMVKGCCMRAMTIQTVLREGRRNFLIFFEACGLWHQTTWRRTIFHPTKAYDNVLLILVVELPRIVL